MAFKEDDETAEEKFATIEEKPVIAGVIEEFRCKKNQWKILNVDKSDGQKKLSSDKEKKSDLTRSISGDFDSDGDYDVVRRESIRSNSKKVAKQEKDVDLHDDDGDFDFSKIKIKQEKTTYSSFDEYSGHSRSHRPTKRVRDDNRKRDDRRNDRRDDRRNDRRDDRRDNRMDRDHKRDRERPRRDRSDDEDRNNDRDFRHRSKKASSNRERDRNELKHDNSKQRQQQQLLRDLFADDCESDEGQAEAEKQRLEAELKRKYQVWGRGVKQTKQSQEQIADRAHESNKPLARYENDEDRDRLLKDRELAEDPMLDYIRRKKQIREAKRALERNETVHVFPKYSGPAVAPQNRFLIPPGYRWDGVDRSNGFEAKLMTKQNESVANQEEAYRWSTADM